MTLSEADMKTIQKAAAILSRSNPNVHKQSQNYKGYSLVTALDEMESGNNWGPGGNLSLNSIWAKQITIPANKIGRFTFSCNAWFENAVLIYESDTHLKICERGNGPYRHTQDWASDISANEKSYLITGWHKNGPADRRLPWVQSPSRVFIDREFHVSVGFEDAGQDDFDDAICSVAIVDR